MARANWSLEPTTGYGPRTHEIWWQLNQYVHLLELLAELVKLVKLVCSIIKQLRANGRSRVREKKQIDLEIRSPDGGKIRYSERWEREE